MTSLNTDVNQLHEAFCAVTGRELRMNPTFERWWFQALQYEINCDMVREVMALRMKGEYTGFSMRMHCLSLKHLIGDDERLAQFLDEAAQIAATRRKKVYSPGKASVLKAAGHDSEPEASPPRHISEVMDEMRKAVK